MTVNRLIVLFLLFTAPLCLAEEAIITGNVQSKCVINVDTVGVYGNPTVDKLSTAPADGGVQPIIRYDVAVGNTYTARLTTPTEFSSSPVLTDVVNWTGQTSVQEFSDAAMSDIDSNKVEYNATSEYNLHTAGSIWFKVDSTAEYGYGKALSGGTYTAVVQADCIAN